MSETRVCPVCHGMRSVGGKMCPRCHGSGKIKIISPGEYPSS